MQIGVIGSWEENLKKDIYQIAEAVGREIALRGGILFTGGSTGIMEAAARGAKHSGVMTVGVIPTERKDAYAALGRYTDVFIMTGMGEYGKLAPLIHSVEGVIAIAGGAGTLMEICMAYLQNKPVVAIPVKGYTSARIKLMLEELFLDHRRIQPIHFAKTAEEAVELLWSLISKKN
jgi:uncharacterized protein (TIGR00725 family)